MNPWELLIWALAIGCSLIILAFLGGIAWLIIKTVREKQ